MQILKIKNKSKRRVRSRNRNRNSVRITVLLFLFMHVSFYLTGFISDWSKYTCSAFRTSQNLSAYKTVTLIRWDYSPEDKTMELVFDLKNNSYSEGTIEFTALYDNTKKLDSQIVYNEQDMIIIQLYKLPKKSGKKVTITFKYTPEGEKDYETKFYSYTGIINEVETLPILSQDEYYLSRQDYDIAYYKELVKEMQNAISKNESSIANIKQDIEKLQSSNTALTTDEMLNLNETIENDKGTIEILEGKNGEYRLQIASYQEIIGVLKERKADYERKNR